MPPDLLDTMNRECFRSIAIPIMRDASRIGAVQHVESGETLLPAEGLIQHFRRETAAAHAEQHHIG